MVDLKNWIGNYFGFNQTIFALQNDNLKLTYSIDDLTLQVKKALESDLTKTAKLGELNKIIELGGKSIKERNYLPSCFAETGDVYKFGFWLKTEQGNSYLEPIDAGGHLCLTSFLYYIINKAKLTGNETALECFNKILGAQQEYTTYIYDQDQWGKNYGENWEPSIVVLNTRKSDCESLSCLAVSAFEYYRLIENKFPEAYAFVGTGWYNWKASNNRFGHGFPCLFIKDANKTFEENFYIGESTLHSVRPVKPLKDSKNMYDISWGCNSFWHDFRLKKELHWWTNSTAGEVRSEEKEKEVEEQKFKSINKFWGSK